MCAATAVSTSSFQSAHRPEAAPSSTASRSLACGIGSKRPIGNAIAIVATGSTTGNAITAISGWTSNAASQPMNSITARAATGSTA
jgi:hypothetical protein